MKYKVLIAGGFKPPHKGHHDFIKFYLDNPDVEEVILFCGEKKRDSVSLEATEAILSAYGLLAHPKLSVNSMQALIQFTVDGLGFAVLPQKEVQHYLANGELVELLPDWQLPDYQVFAVVARAC